MRGILKRRISQVWLVPVASVALPFVLGTLGRLCLGVGWERLGSRLIWLVIRYGELPGVLLGLSPQAAPESVLGYCAAGLFYSLPVLLAVVSVRLMRATARRSWRVG